MSLLRLALSGSLSLVFSLAAVAQTGQLDPPRRRGTVFRAWDARAHFDAGFPPALSAQVWLGWSRRFRIFDINAFDRIDDLVDDYAYGYIRPHIRALTAFRAHQLDVRTDLYPFSFFGFTLGGVASALAFDGIENFRRFSGYACGTPISCSGFNNVFFVESKFKWAAWGGNIFGEFLLRWDWASSDANTPLRYDTATGLPFQASGDRGFEAWAVVGHRIDDRSSVATRWRRYGWRDSDAIQHDLGVSYAYSWDNPWSGGIEFKQSFRNQTFHAGAIGLRATYEWRESPEPQ